MRGWHEQSKYGWFIFALLTVVGYYNGDEQRGPEGNLLIHHHIGTLMVIKKLIISFQVGFTTSDAAGIAVKYEHSGLEPRSWVTFGGSSCFLGGS